MAEGVGKKSSGEVAKSGVRIGAAAAGGFLSAVMGPEGGAGAGQALSEMGESLVDHVLDKRRKDRVIRVLQRAAGEIEERRAAGERLRDEIANPNSDDAAAVFEAVVDAAARSFEEKKGQAIANLYASITFNQAVSISDAILYLSRIRSASWRQLVVVQFVASDERRAERKRIERSLLTVAGGVMHPMLRAELLELFGRGLGLVGIYSSDGQIREPSEIESTNQYEDVKNRVEKYRLTDLGEAIVQLTRLGEIVSTTELDDIAAGLDQERTTT